jgi:predicted negative regulator of RcsB-dependent stress response
MSSDPAQSPTTPGESSRPLGEIAQGPGAFELFLDRNQGTLAALAVVLALGAAGLVVYRGIADGREKAGGAALSTANDTATLQGVLINHGNTVAAGSAALLLADQQWAEGDRDAAIQTLRDLVNQQGSHATAPSARASLASKLAATGQRDEARTHFQAIADDPAARFLAPYALISLGDLERSAGDLDAARNLYERARTDFPGSNFAENANRRLAVLDAQPPVEIEAPPAPPEPQDLPTGFSPGAPPSPFSFGTDPTLTTPAAGGPAPGFFDATTEPAEPTEPEVPAEETETSPETTEPNDQTEPASETPEPQAAEEPAEP